MNHTDCIGKTLGDLVKDTPDYALNFYRMYHNGKVVYLPDVLCDEELLKKEIEEIRTIFAGYDYDIIFKTVNRTE